MATITPIYPDIPASICSSSHTNDVTELFPSPQRRSNKCKKRNEGDANTKCRLNFSEYISRISRALTACQNIDASDFPDEEDNKKEKAPKVIPAYNALIDNKPTWQSVVYTGETVFLPPTIPCRNVNNASPSMAISTLSSTQGAGLIPARMENSNSAGYVHPTHLSDANMVPSVGASSENNHKKLNISMDTDGFECFQKQMYLPQPLSTSHMTAPISRGAFHPGFNYATQFKYHYNYYPTDHYVGELDKETKSNEPDGTSDLPNSSNHQISPILVSKTRLESGRAPVLN